MRIAELEARSGLSRHTIRFYEQNGVIAAPQRSDNGYRDYDEEVVGELEFLRRAQGVGFTLAEISTILAHLRDRSMDCAQGAELADARLTEVDQRILELAEVRSALEHARRELVDSALANNLTLPARLIQHRT